MSVLHNWQEEKRSAYLYGLIANREIDPIRKKLFFELAGVAERQADIWRAKFTPDEEKQAAVYKPDFRTRLVGQLVKYFSTRQIRFILSAMKVRGMSIYATAPSSHATETHLEHRHKGVSAAGNLRAAVFGVNDGLVSNVSLLLGVVGANADHNFIVLSGVAGLLAGACSMASGEYVSVRSQREFFEYQIELEKEELELYPEEEALELECIYRARGLPQEEAHKLANLMIGNPQLALDTLAREELGLNPDELGSPWGAAISSFSAFGFGAFIPLLPFLLGIGHLGLLVSILLTSAALFFVGSLLSLFTNRSAILGGLRMMLIGALAGGLTYVIGNMLRVTLY